MKYDPETGVLTGPRGGAGSINEKGYVVIRFMGKVHKAHRVAFYLMMGRWPTEIDHVNRVRHDNRWCNLREVTHKENQRNRKPGRKQGVRQLESGKWKASIGGSKNRKHLGMFDTREQALEARHEAEWALNYYATKG